MLKIIVDVNHPADVHFFKHFIREMELRGHKVLVTASEKEVSYKLLDAYGLSYTKLGSYGEGPIRKFFNLFGLDWKMLRIAHSFQPDVFVGHCSVRAAHASAIMGIPYVATDDTEHAKVGQALYLPFADYVLTPDCYQKNLGDRGIPFAGYMELLYLHPDRFQPDPKVLDEIGLKMGDPFTIVRFVSWDAAHDLGQKGVEDKIGMVKLLEKICPVYISSESTLPRELEKNRLDVSPEKMHDLLYYASLYVGEGATTASEAAVLGTPAIYVNTLRVGYLTELDEKYGLVFHAKTNEEALDIARKILTDPESNVSFEMRRFELLRDKMDATFFLIQFVESLGGGQ